MCVCVCVRAHVFVCASLRLCVCGGGYHLRHLDVYRLHVLNLFVRGDGRFFLEEPDAESDGDEENAVNDRKREERYVARLDNRND
jgi:hypothetical protein